MSQKQDKQACIEPHRHHAITAGLREVRRLLSVIALRVTAAAVPRVIAPPMGSFPARTGVDPTRGDDRHWLMPVSSRDSMSCHSHLESCAAVAVVASDV